MQRMPKLRGFKSFKPASEVVYTGQLESLKGKTVDNASLAEAGLISSAFVNVKLVFKGDISAAKTIKLQGASVGAIEAVEKAGGSFEVIDRQSRPVTNENNKKSRKAKKEAAEA